jgi:hypothetical protein
LLALTTLGYYNDGIIFNLTHDMMFFTYWGKYFTLITIITSIYVDNDDVEPVEKQKNINKDYLTRKYSIFQAWKWFGFFYPFTFIAEMIITIEFWALLFDTYLGGKVPMIKIL